MDNFEIDVAIQGAIPDLTDEEFEQLTENILNDGKVTDPIIVWENKIVDGIHRWKIIQEHPEIPYTVEYMDFPDEYSAIYWACVRQTGRRNLKQQDWNFVLDTAYTCVKKTVGAPLGNQNAKKTNNCEEDDLKQSDQIDLIVFKNENKSANAARQITAKSMGVSEGRVSHATKAVKAVNLADEAVPGFRDDYRAGNIKVSDDMIEKAMKVPEEGREAVASAIKNITIHNTAEEINEGKKQLNSIFKSYTGTDLINKKESEESKLAFKSDLDNEESESSEDIPSFEDWSLQEAMKDPVYAEHADEHGVNQLGAISSENLERFRFGLESAIRSLQEIEDTDFADEMFTDNEVIDILNDEFSAILELINKYKEQIKDSNAE